MASETGGDIPVTQLVIDIVDIRRRTGSHKEFRAVTALDAMEAGEFGVVDGRLEVALEIEAVTEGVVAKGTAHGRWTGPCRRCLDPIVAPLEVEVHEIFERTPTEGETWPIENERIDLAPVLREAALLSLPLVPLCRDDCEGPEPSRYVASIEADVDLTSGRPTPDPRWAALDELRFDD
jgi:DUF177 domain-containing protein